MLNTLKTTALLGLLSGLLLVIGEALGGAQGMVLAFFIAAAMNFASYWFSDRMVLRMYRAQEVGPDNRLYQVVSRLAQKAGLPQPRVYIIPEASPNAFATGRNPDHAAVAATQGILNLLDDDELEGVIAHELGHVRHRDILTSSVAATLAAAVMLLGRFVEFAALFGGYGGRDQRSGNVFGMLATIIMAPLAAMLIQMAISRSREYAADQAGASLVGRPDGLVSALRKIDAVSKRVPLAAANPATAHLFIISPFSAGGVRALFSTHPRTEDRIAKLLGRRAVTERAAF